jgi:Protein of unknown function (DUF2844)
LDLVEPAIVASLGTSVFSLPTLWARVPGIVGLRDRVKNGVLGLLQGEWIEMVRGSWLPGIAMAMLALPSSASASLGGDTASVQADQMQMSATLRRTGAANYTLFEIETPFGTVVREYISSAGVVFAVAWNGPALPDFRQLLGSFFGAYIQGTNAQGAGARPRVIEQPRLVVQAGGHMRAFLGRAFVTDLFPTGVNLEEIH